MKEKPTPTQEQGPKYLETVRNIDKAIEVLGNARKGDAVGMEINAGSLQQKEEYVNDLKQEFKRRKVKVKLRTDVMLDQPRGWWLMTITKDSD